MQKTISEGIDDLSVKQSACGSPKKYRLRLFLSLFSLELSCLWTLPFLLLGPSLIQSAFFWKLHKKVVGLLKVIHFPTHYLAC